MKVIFFANGAFSIPSLQSLVDSKFSVVSVVTNSDKLGGRGRKNLETDVGVFANTLSLPLIKTDDLNNEEFYSQIKSLKADVFIVISYRIIPKKVFSIPLCCGLVMHKNDLRLIQMIILFSFLICFGGLIFWAIEEPAELAKLAQAKLDHLAAKEKVLGLLNHNQTLFDLLQEVAIETRKSEIILYQCEHTKFKM